jgi:glycosyltransferase involved in cell wall biosynthesis
MRPLIEVICVTYQQPGPLSVLVQSFINQTADNWKLVVYHDGPDDGFVSLMKEFEQKAPGKIVHRSTSVRHNDWGHSLSEKGIKRATGDYILLTNGDNYYVPVFIEMVTNALAESKADMVIFDMVHSYKNANLRPSPPYSYLKTAFEWLQLDMGAAVVRTPLAKAVGFRDKTAGGDQTYFADIRHHADLTICKINSVLFVHN